MGQKLETRRQKLEKQKAEAGKSKGLLEVRTAQEGCETRVAAQGIEEGVHFKELQDVRSFLSGTLHPCKCLLLVTESGVGVQKRGRRYITGLSPPMKFVENAQRFRAAARAPISVREHAQDTRAAVRNGSGFLQDLDGFIMSPGASKGIAEKPQSHWVLRLYGQDSAQFPNGFVVATGMKENQADFDSVKGQRVQLL